MRDCHAVGTGFPDAVFSGRYSLLSFSCVQSGCDGRFVGGNVHVRMDGFLCGLEECIVGLRTHRSEAPSTSSVVMALTTTTT